MEEKQAISGKELKTFVQGWRGNIHLEKNKEDKRRQELENHYLKKIDGQNWHNLAP